MEQTGQSPTEFTIPEPSNLDIYLGDMEDRIKVLEKDVKSLRGMVFLAMKKKKNG